MSSGLVSFYRMLWHPSKILFDILKPIRAKEGEQKKNLKRNILKTFNGATRMRHQCNEITALSCHVCLIFQSNVNVTEPINLHQKSCITSTLDVIRHARIMQPFVYPCLVFESRPVSLPIIPEKKHFILL